jgi:hypothetical protein
LIFSKERDKAVELGYPPGFFEQTWGSLADEHLERPSQGEYEVRDAIESSFVRDQ